VCNWQVNEDWQFCAWLDWLLAIAFSSQAPLSSEAPLSWHRLEEVFMTIILHDDHSSEYCGSFRNS